MLWIKWMKSQRHAQLMVLHVVKGFFFFNCSPSSFWSSHCDWQLAVWTNYISSFSFSKNFMKLELEYKINEQAWFCIFWTSPRFIDRLSLPFLNKSNCTHVLVKNLNKEVSTVSRPAACGRTTEIAELCPSSNLPNCRLQIAYSIIVAVQERMTACVQRALYRK